MLQMSVFMFENDLGRLTWRMQKELFPLYGWGVDSPGEMLVEKGVGG